MRGSGLDMLAPPSASFGLYVACSNTGPRQHTRSAEPKRINNSGSQERQRTIDAGALGFYVPTPVPGSFVAGRVEQLALLVSYQQKRRETRGDACEDDARGSWAMRQRTGGGRRDGRPDYDPRSTSLK